MNFNYTRMSIRAVRLMELSNFHSKVDQRMNRIIYFLNID